MRLVDSGDVAFPGTDVGRVADATISHETVHDVYGDDSDVGPWSRRGVRRVRLTVARPAGLDGIIRSSQPEQDQLRATLKQWIARDERSSGGPFEVHGSVRLHVLGAELIKIRPRTSVVPSEDKCGARMRTTIELHAVFPPPLAGIVENIMAAQATHEVARFNDAVRRNVQRSPG